MNPFDPFSLTPSRGPIYAPMTERDEVILSTAAWLDAEGYTPAAAVLRAVVGRHQIVTLEELKQSNPETLSSMKLNMDLRCRIWSNERYMYWRPNGSGYTYSALEAGLYTFWAAHAATSHCGREKGIWYEILPESAARPEKVSGWKS